MNVAWRPWGRGVVALSVLLLSGCPETPVVPEADAALDAPRADAPAIDGALDTPVRVDAGGDAPVSCVDPDVDDDGEDAIACGGTDCDDTNAERGAGRTEICDAADVDEDCVLSTFGTNDLDLDGHVDAACCNTDPAGEPLCGLDCDDTRADVGPGSGDFCDGRDNDCDGRTDEAPVETFYPDADGDGFGDADGAAMSACARPVGYVSLATDCDDSRAATSPAAPETCNTMDDDCDTMVDEGDAAPLTFYRDVDGDMYGGATTVSSCTAPTGYVSLGGDCNDTRAATNPGLPEICDGIDNNCMGGIDEGSAAPTTWYRDQDGDLYGGTMTMSACTAPAGYVGTSTDCNDTSAGVHPGASEVCNGASEDCDVRIDEGPTGGTVCSCSPLGMTRSCGLGACAAATQMCTMTGWSACAITPQPETCDTRDNDCDGMTDELPDAIASCMDPPNSAPRCAAGGGCTFACDTGYANCDAMTTNGCEVRLSLGTVVSDDRVDDCGACGTDCVITSNTTVSGARCTGGAGTCTMACTGTRLNCNGVYADGCEVDSATSPTHCGVCGTACTAAPANGTAVCTAGSCGFVCNPGYYRPAGMSSCVAVPAPRLIGPLSTSMVTSECPTARLLLTSPTDSAEIQICRDRACTMVHATLTTTGTVGLCPSGGLFNGVYFWRARGRIGTNVGPGWSPVWQLRVRNTVVVTVPDAGGSVVGSELDVRGDGFSDVAIGENEADRVRLFFGSATGLPASTPSATVTSPDAGAGRFGISVTSAGDVNGDGYGELLVGASGPNGTSGDTPSAASNTNVAYVYAGGASAPGAVPTRLSAGAGSSATSGFGYSVASAGDVNRDGYGDVVVGAYFDQRAFVYLGSATGLATTPAATLSPPDAVTGGLFGLSVIGTDLNADGFGDVVVGRALVTPAVFVYCGSATGVGTTPCATFTGPMGTNFGISVAAGDVNVDGAPDLVVGGNGGMGIAQVFFGRATTFDTTADGSWTATTTGTGFGVSVAALSFIGADYTADVVVGAPGSSTVYVFRGGSVLSTGTTALAADTLTDPTALFGRHIARGGGDGQYEQLVLSACTPGMPGMCANRVWVWDGQSSALPAAAHRTWMGTSGFGIGCNR